MGLEIADGLRALERAAARARSLVIEIDEAYLRYVAEVEAMPSNQSGTDKTWVFDAQDAAERHFASAVRVR